MFLIRVIIDLRRQAHRRPFVNTVKNKFTTFHNRYESTNNNNNNNINTSQVSKVKIACLL